MLQKQMRCQIKTESLLFPTMYKPQNVTFPTCSGFCGSGSHIIDTSIKNPISGQSSPMVKGCVDIMCDIVDAAFRY